MKLLSFSLNREKHIGLFLKDSVIDLSCASQYYRLPDILSDMISFLKSGSRALSAARKIECLSQKDFEKGVSLPFLYPFRKSQILPPVDRPEKIICIGQNYIDHCREQGVKPPDRPIIFAKFWNALNGPYKDIVIPTISNKIDYEAELAVVIGKSGKYIPQNKAMHYVAGYMVLNDVTARDIQKSDGQWIRGKSSDTFAPCGPWLITCDEIIDPHNLNIQLKLNGKIMQDSNTRNLIFNIPCLISFISQNMTLQPGDIISTGTPPGVGFTRKPPVYLKKGDIIETSIQSIGSLLNKVK